MSNSPTIDESRREVLTANLLKSRAARPPEDVASAIVDGITKNKSRVLVGTDTKAIDKIVRLVPASYPRIMAPMLRKLLDKTLNS